MAFIKSVEVYFPAKKISNTDISSLFPEWSSDKIFDKIGITNRNIADLDEFVSDMAVKVVNKLCAENNLDKSKIDYLIICTQSPDYKLPTTACIVQDRVGLSTSCAAIDINQGCSGYIYGLSLAKGLINSGDFHNVVLVTSETYSKYIHESDKGNMSLFGDAATATLISSDSGGLEIGKFDLGSDGSGFENLIVKNGGARHNYLNDFADRENHLFMNGSAIFDFTSKNVPPLVKKNLENNSETLEGINYFIFHQANTFMLNFLRKRIGISEGKFLIDMEHCGNTVSSSIPIAMKTNIEKLTKVEGEKTMLVGFGVGYSWGAITIYNRIK